MRSPRLKSIVLGGLAVAVGLVAATLWSFRGNETTSRVDRPRDTTARRTVADVWRWDGKTKQTSEKATATTGAVGRIEPEGVAKGLGRVELDQNGNVIVGRNARTALEESFAAIPTDLSPEEMQALQNMIRAGLPGPAGEQVAKLVGDYYSYRAAVQAFETKNPRGSNVDAERARVEQLAALRRQHLGPVAAAKFYGEDQAMERYLLERQRAQSAPGADPASPARLQQDLSNGLFFFESRNSPAALELKRQMEVLRAQKASDEYVRYVQTQQLGLHTASELARTDAERSDWQRRYAQFQQQRQYVLNAGLSEEDKRAQIDALLKQHFKDEELEVIRAYNNN